MIGLLILLARNPVKRPVIAFPGNMRDPMRGPRLPMIPNLMKGTIEMSKPTSAAQKGPSM